MTYRTILAVSRALAFAACFLGSACSREPRSSSRTTGASVPTAPGGLAGGASAIPSGRGGAVASSSGDVRTPLKANHVGRIPILEYHVIGGDKNALYTRTRASFLADLEDVYRRGYRPITMSQLLDKDFSSVPDGMSPVVVVFDDASPSQFSYVEQNGQLAIDTLSAVGTWLEFAKTHPGWGNRAVFCMLNGGASGHNFFGDGPKWNGQHRQWRLEKVRWLAANGFELCAHTLWHAMLNKYPDNVVQEQIARNVMGIDSAVAGYRVRTFALPYGIWPKNRGLAWQGAWTDPKTGKVYPYKFDAVLEVSGGPARSPYDPQFDARSVKRIQAIGDDIQKTLDKLDQTGTRFVK
jgi:Polysaccharide deacetylase